MPRWTNAGDQLTSAQKAAFRSEFGIQGQIDENVADIAALEASVDGLENADVSVVIEDSYEISQNDNGKILFFVSGTAVTVTLVESTTQPGFNVALVQGGDGEVTVSPGSTTVYSLNSSLELAGKYAAASLVRIASDEYLLSGALA